MRRIDYDEKESYSGNTDNQVAVDQAIQPDYLDQNRFEEGFSSAHGVRPETSETAGTVRHPDMKDDSRPDSFVNTIEEENPGLADS